MSGFILAIDQGTTSTRAIVFDGSQKVVGLGAEGVPPALSRVRLGRARSGGDLGRASLSTVQGGAREGRQLAAADIAAIGITNQRETTSSGTGDGQADPQRHRLAGPPHGRALRTARGGRGSRSMFTQKTGLLLDPYFSGTKIAWLLDNVKGARKRAERGRARLRHRRHVSCSGG